MTNLQKLLFVFLGLALVGGGIWLYRERSPVREGGPAGPPKMEQESNPMVSEPVPVPAGSGEAKGEAGAAKPAESGSNAAPAVVPDPPWKIQMDMVLNSGSNPENKARQLLAMLPTLDTNGQTVVAGEMVKLLDDEHFSLAEPLLMNPEMPETVLDVVMANLYERPTSMKLPLWLAVAGVENHPLREEAFSVLEVYVEEDYGTDLAAWRRAVEAKLKEEEAAP